VHRAALVLLAAVASAAACSNPGTGVNAAGVCNPPCRDKLFAGCAPAGTCTKADAGTAMELCYSNGVQVQVTATSSTFSRDGGVCSTIEATADRGTYNVRAADGTMLGTLIDNGDGSNTLICAGETPVMVPAACALPACVVGACPSP
jgi:hypothetical protein